MQSPLPDPSQPQPSDALPIPHPTNVGGTAVSDHTLGGLIPMNNAPALKAYYIGLFSLLPVFGLVMAPLAVSLGRKGLRNVAENPAVQGKTHAWVGIICGGFWTVVHYIALALFVVALLSPNP